MRLHEKVPISDICKAHGHEPSLDKELRYRHIIPFLPFGKGGNRKHPVPTLQSDSGSPFNKMTFTQKKELLKVDEEQRWRTNKALNSEWNWNDVNGLDQKTFQILHPEVVFKFPVK